MNVIVFLNLVTLILLRPYPGLVDWLGTYPYDLHNASSPYLEGQVSKILEILLHQGVPQATLESHLTMWFWWGNFFHFGAA